MRPIKAVIFDMDGVLIDSEPVYLQHQYAHLKPSYPWITVESMYPLVGISGQEYMPFMAKLCRRTDDAAFRQEMDAMNAGCQVYYPDILRKEVRPLLHELKQMGLQVALASSSSRECIEQVLTQCKIRELFDCIVSGHEFTHSKPDPEIYRFTMDKLRRKPEECLIVEDSTYGVQAGTASGGVVAALRDERFPFDQRAAQLHIDSLAELPALAACGGKRIRAAFFDVDGTLLTVGGHRMPPGVAPALQALQRSGVQVFLCTGRNLRMTKPLLAYGFDGFVCSAGGYVGCDGKILVDLPMEPAQVEGLREVLGRAGAECTLEARDDTYGGIKMIERFAHLFPRKPGQLNSEAERWRKTMEYGLTIRPIEEYHGEPVYKVVFIAPNEACLAEAKQLYEDQFIFCESRLGDNPSAIVNGELINRKFNKGTGIKAICDELGCSLADTIGFGDSDNDLQMTDVVGISVCMANGSDNLKKLCDRICPAVTEDGVARELKTLGLI